MAVNNNNNNKQKQQQQQYRYYDPMAAVRAQMTMQGNNAYLLGDILGGAATNWLSEYLQKLKEKYIHTGGGSNDSVTPYDGGDTVHQLSNDYMNDRWGNPNDRIAEAMSGQQFTQPPPNYSDWNATLPSFWG